MPISTSRTKSSSACPGHSTARRIVGIDPGLSATGYGVIENGQVLDFGVISTDTKETVAVRLNDLATRLDRVIRRNKPRHCAIETLFFKGGGARSVILSAQSRGVILALLAKRSLTVKEVTPATVKLAVTGSGRASKQQMNYMIKQLLGLTDRVPEHAADALAAAFCLAQRLPQDGDGAGNETAGDCPGFRRSRQRGLSPAGWDTIRNDDVSAMSRPGRKSLMSRASATRQL